MRLPYCDLCDCPIHQKSYIISVFENNFSYRSSGAESFRNSSSNVTANEICKKCNIIIASLFRERKEGLAKLVKEIEEINSLSSKETNK